MVRRNAAPWFHASDDELLGARVARSANPDDSVDRCLMTVLERATRQDIASSPRQPQTTYERRTRRPIIGQRHAPASAQVFTTAVRRCGYRTSRSTRLTSSPSRRSARWQRRESSTSREAVSGARERDKSGTELTDHYEVRQSGAVSIIVWFRSPQRHRHRAYRTPTSKRRP
jgi:hypothetical protein